MQTFLPYSNFTATANCLDLKRLNNQINEAIIILKSNLGLYPSGGWCNHPAAKMWDGFELCLVDYILAITEHWVFRTSRKKEDVFNRLDPVVQNFVVESFHFTPSVIKPKFLGDEEFHNSHKSNLLRKDPEFYSQYNWDIPDNLSYVWPIRNN